MSHGGLSKAGRPQWPPRSYLNCNVVAAWGTNLLHSYALAVDDIDTAALDLADLATVEVIDFSLTIELHIADANRS